MSKPIAKITVRCPHCSAEQQEPAQAKSTFCRCCSQYFAITSDALAGAAAPAAPARLRPSFASATVEATSDAASALLSGGSGFKNKLESFLSSKPRHRTARCFECNSQHEVSSTAQSSTCKACGAYIDLQDYKINGSFSRNIKTRGSVYLSTKGDLSSSKIVCSQATLHGKMRGNLQCDGLVTIRAQGRMPGSFEAGEIIVEKGSEVIFARPIKAASVAVHGLVTGDIVSDSSVLISKSGSVEGSVSATGITVEKGGIFQGELTITPRQPPAREPSQSEGIGGGQPASATSTSLLDGGTPAVA